MTAEAMSETRARKRRGAWGAATPDDHHPRTALCDCPETAEEMDR